MAPIVERDLADAAVDERADRREAFAFGFEIGEGGAENAAQTALSAQAALHVEEVGFDPLGPRFVEAGFDDFSGFRERGQVAPLVPGPPVGRATEGMTATVASLRKASRISRTSEVTTEHRQSR